MEEDGIFSFGLLNNFLPIPRNTYANYTYIITFLSQSKQRLTKYLVKCWACFFTCWPCFKTYNFVLLTKFHNKQLINMLVLNVVCALIILSPYPSHLVTGGPGGHLGDMKNIPPKSYTVIYRPGLAWNVLTPIPP